MKILNLYAGIGGNRKHWDAHDITAVEHDPDIAQMYATLHPNDTVIIGDAHNYLLDHHSEYDFIWSSPPCQTHSRLIQYNRQKIMDGRLPTKYPDMKLYEEILFLRWAGTNYAVENVQPYYTPLIRPTAKLGRHLFWSSFTINTHVPTLQKFTSYSISNLEQYLDITLPSRSTPMRDRQILRNCTHPDIGRIILDAYKSNVRQETIHTS